jgi:hypothetical protein
MKFDDMFAKEHIDRWTKAWNDHDVTEILSLYSEDISFHSPKVALLYPDLTSARISNKRDLEEYFSLGLKRFPRLHFTPRDYFLKDRKVIIEYYGTPDNKTQWSVIQEFDFNDDGLIEKSSVYYGAEDQYSK